MKRKVGISDQFFLYGNTRIKPDDSEYPTQFKNMERTYYNIMQGNSTNISFLNTDRGKMFNVHFGENNDSKTKFDKLLIFLFLACKSLINFN